jgi:hypothetical protein
MVPGGWHFKSCFGNLFWKVVLKFVRGVAADHIQRRRALLTFALS